MSDGLQMSTVAHTYIDGSEVYNIYDGTGTNLRRIWPSTERPTPSRQDLSSYFRLVSYSSGTISPTSTGYVFTHASPRQGTIEYQGSSLPSGYSKIVIYDVEIVSVFTDSATGSVEWPVDGYLISGNIVDVSDTATYTKSLLNAGGESYIYTGYLFNNFKLKVYGRFI